MADFEFDVFLSHNSSDKPLVRKLKQLLAKAGLRVWLDEDELRPGINWQPLLEEGVRSSKSIAVLIGADGGFHAFTLAHHWPRSEYTASDHRVVCGADARSGTELHCQPAALSAR